MRNCGGALARRPRRARPSAEHERQDAAEVQHIRVERRFAPRRRSEIPALIYFEGTSVSVPCVIRDMSATGARLELREGWAERFTADISNRDKISLVIRVDRVAYSCRIVRRTETEFGVKFAAAPKPINKLF